MLNKDLMLTQSLIVFENLRDLLDSVDEYLVYCNSAMEAYGEHLGNLIRRGKASGQASTGQPLNESRKDGVQQKRTGGRDDKEPWVTFMLGKENDPPLTLRVANTSIQSPTSAESAVLFRVIEALKVKIRYLDSARKIISELPSRGIRADQRFLVSFVEGLPRQIIPTNQSYATEDKFQYDGDFEIQTMDVSEALAPSS